MAGEVKAAIHEVLRQSRFEPARVLEVGGVMGPKSLLDSPVVATAERVVLNMAPVREEVGVEFVLGNANDMPFEDEPGGLLIIAVPGFVKDPERDRGRWTRTYRVHFAFDYYRFSEQAVAEVFFDGMERVGVQALLIPPRIVGHGYAPAR
jgi:hypothetical protein